MMLQVGIQGQGLWALLLPPSAVLDFVQGLLDGKRGNEGGVGTRTAQQETGKVFHPNSAEL